MEKTQDFLMNASMRAYFGSWITEGKEGMSRISLYLKDIERHTAMREPSTDATRPTKHNRDICDGVTWRARQRVNTQNETELSRPKNIS